MGQGGRTERDACPAAPAAGESFDKCRLERGRAQPAIAADGDTLAALLGEDCGKGAAERARIRLAQRVVDHAADIVFAQDGGVENVAASGAAVAHGLPSSPLQQYSLRICLTASLMSGRDRAKAMLA